MNKKYLCPKHKDTNPSAHAYHDHYFCFACNARGPLSDLGLSSNEKPVITYVEDVKATIDYINTLPKQKVRGFTLPVSARGYYLVWPQGTYYKLRLSREDSQSKYRGPTGHPKPKFVAQSGSFPRLVLVEGEFNALSLAALELPWDVVSPGAAGDFYSKGRALDLQEYAKYSRVDIVVDDDAAGLQAAIECCAQLKVLGCENVKAWFVKEDFNQIYAEKGKEALKKTIDEMGML